MEVRREIMARSEKFTSTHPSGEAQAPKKYRDKYKSHCDRPVTEPCSVRQIWRFFHSEREAARFVISQGNLAMATRQKIG